MKRLLLLAVVPLLFAQCKKEEVTAASAGSSLESGIVTGTVRANLNTTNDTLGGILNLEPVPAGTVLTFTVDSEELILNPLTGVNYPETVQQVTIGANGTYSISLPSIPNGAEYDVRFEDFSYPVITGYNSVGMDPFGDTITSLTTFSRADATVIVSDFITKIEDSQY